jgi:excinuclease ABC subunit B
LRAHIEGLEAEMREAAADLEFETAARLRDEIKRLQETELAVANDPFARQSEVDARVADQTGVKNKAAPRQPKRRRKGP